jgi:hypothetical protein
MRRGEEALVIKVVAQQLALWLVVFLLITVGEHLTALATPRTLVGSVWGPISAVVWIVLAARFVRESRWEASDLLAVTHVALLGAVSGFVGAFAGWLIYATGHGAPYIYVGGIGSLQVYGFEGGMGPWAIVGAAVCGVVGLIARKRQQPVSD